MNLMMSMAGGLSGGAAGIAIGSTVSAISGYYDDAIGAWEGSLANRQGQINKLVGEALAKNYMVIGNTLNREVGVAYSVLGLLEAIDEWRKIDPHYFDGVASRCLTVCQDR